VIRHSEGAFLNARHAAMIDLMSTGTTLYVDRGRYEIHPGNRAYLGGQAAWWKP